MALTDIRLVSVVPADYYRPLLGACLSVKVSAKIITTVRPLLLSALSVQAEGVSGEVATFHQLSSALYVYVVGVTKVQISVRLSLSSGLSVTVRRGVSNLAVMLLSAGLRSGAKATVPTSITLSLAGGLGPGAKVTITSYVDLSVGASLLANVAVKPKTQITVYLSAALGTAAQIPYTQSDSGLMLAISLYSSAPNPKIKAVVGVASPAIAPNKPTVTTAWSHNP